ncbi:hypothetical protein D1007_58771 [Hordeum vulgare]|uniref:LysM domain-containing protein n=1 Tax=Hordeum vulgare subsp. vulgare TaxID=112509 RepID=A0A8I6X414_HORVV|nr:uncharacterized protein LOC123440340 [Hordeum vulgare subsp. vulgare]KAE8769628.1 hypothetical protein D1007_58771 [Hordeum vulgare]KAI5007378.1 hypothetical protein ZWY2020_050823 [Hordeum vulgare]
MANHGAAALLIASLLVAVTLADARVAVQVRRDLNEGHVMPTGDAKAVAALTCSKVQGLKSGETCFSVALLGGLTLESFLVFNPNIDCGKTFVGQWVCLHASTA